MPDPSSKKNAYHLRYNGQNDVMRD